MATPTISEYTAHLRQDKATMRNFLLSANIETKESDTFTDLTRIALEKGNAIRRIYVQPDEPASKYGLWFKRDKVDGFDVVSDPVPLVAGSYTQGSKIVDPDTPYDRVKESYSYVVNGTLYYVCMDCLPDYNPNEILRIYKYNTSEGTWTRLQTYTSAELISVRGETSGGYTHSFRSNANMVIDDDENYLYIVGGNYNSASAESNKYITRFGLKTHTYERVHTKLSNWFSISSPGTSDGAQIVDNKIYVFGHSTSAGSYGPTYSTKIIDLDTGTETNLNLCPIAFGGTTIKVNSHLIAGFGGGSSNYNSGSGMTHVRLFDTNTNTVTLICYLTNKNNQRVLAVVGNLIYFAEYRYNGVVAKSVGYVNLTDNSVTYIDDVFTPKIESLAVGRPLYIPESNTILFGRPTTNYALYQLESKPYNKDTVVLFQSTSIAAQYTVDLFTTDGFATDVNFGISDAWFYKAGSGLETTGEVYYGDGENWQPLVHGTTDGGVNPLKLQNKTVSLIGCGTKHIIPDAGFDGLSYIDLDYATDLNIYKQLEEPTAKEGIWFQTEQELNDRLTVVGDPFNRTTFLSSWILSTKLPSVSINYGPYGIIDDSLVFIRWSGYSSEKINLVTGEKTLLPSTEYGGNRGYSAFVQVGEDLYIFGGNEGNSYLSALKYNLRDGTQSELPNLPSNVSYGRAVVVGSDIYIQVGATGTTVGTSNKLFKYNINKGTYSTITMPYYLRNNLMVYNEGYIYIFSYFSTNNANGAANYKLVRYDIHAGTFDIISDLPISQRYWYGALHGKDIYCVCNTNNKAFYVYHIDTNTWETLTDTAPSWSSTVTQLMLLNNTIYAIANSKFYCLDFVENPEYTDETDTLLMYQKRDGNKYNTVLNGAINLGNRLLTGFEDVSYYSTESGVDNTIPTYYGDGTQWIKFKN